MKSSFRERELKSARETFSGLSVGRLRAMRRELRRRQKKWPKDRRIQAKLAAINEVMNGEKGI